MSLDHKIFESKSERDRWDNQIDYYSSKLNLDTVTKVDILKALNHLKLEIKTGFLISSSLHHPIKTNISNKATHAIKWLIWLSQSLKRIKSQSLNYPTLIEKLTSSNSAATEGVPYLILSNWFCDENIILEFEPLISDKKKPDIKLTLLKEKTIVFIEVVSFHSRQNWNALHEINFHILEQVNSNGLNYSGLILRDLNLVEQKAAKILIAESIQECYRRNGLEIITPETSNNMLHLAFSPLNNKTEFNKWLKIYNYNSGSIGAPLNSTQDLISTLGNKLEKKVKQIPSECVGLVAINLSQLYFISLKKIEIIEYVNQRMKSNSIYNRILGVVLWNDQTWGVKENSSVKILNAHYLEIKLWESYSRKLLFIENANTNFDISNLIKTIMLTKTGA